MSAAPRTLVDIVVARAAATPDEAAFRWLNDASGDGIVITYAELDRRARAVGAALRRAGAVGERVLLAYPPGPDFIFGFIGALYGGATAVPISPLYPGRLDRGRSVLGSIIQDAAPAAAVTVGSLVGAFAEFDDKLPNLARLRIITTDDLGPAPATWTPPQMDERSVALQQYTSGSTSLPRGVVVTHGNLLHNADAIRQAMRVGPASIGVIWLPPHHDMGLIGGIVEPLYAGFTVNLMSPLTLLQRPLRWLQAISRWRATVTGGPNFAFDLAVSRTTPEQRAALSLGSVEVAFCGAEPIRVDTVDRFCDAFAVAGFRRESFRPCYGLAESTLIVAGDGTGVPVLFDADAASLEQRRARRADGLTEQKRCLVSSGRPVPGLNVAIVDPDSGDALEDGEIGEIWIAGPSVAQGYWNRPDDTDRLFRARIAGTNEGPFLRSGDLGFLDNGELFVTGRLKDLIIIDGRNLYPHDIEATAEQAHPGIRPASAAAFAVEDGGSERLVVAIEIDRDRLRAAARAGADSTAANQDIVRAVRRTVGEAHDVAVHGVALLPPGGVPRTTSGKIQRNLCRKAFESREFQNALAQ
jgi:acyl-CoA synthetase (AMP-forming)/AMP-acid ligase II